MSAAPTGGNGSESPRGAAAATGGGGGGPAPLRRTTTIKAPRRTLLPNEPMSDDEDAGNGGGGGGGASVVVRITAPATPPERTRPTPIVAVQPASATRATFAPTAAPSPTSSGPSKPSKVVSHAVASSLSDHASPHGGGGGGGGGGRAHNRRKSMYGGRRASRATGRVNGRGGWEESESSSSSKYRFFYGAHGEKLSLLQAIRNWVRRRWVLNPRGRKRQWWNFMIFVVLIFYIIEIPLRLGFQIDNCNTCATTVLHLMCDIVFCIDMVVLQPRTSYFMDELNKSVLETNARKIAKGYFMGWFAFDFVTSLPIHHVLVYYFDVRDEGEIAVSFLVQFCYLLRMLKIFRFVEILHYYHSVELSAGTIWADLLKIVKFVFGFFCIAHMSACVWMFIALRERIDRHVPLEEATWNFMSWPGSLGYIVPPNASSLAVTGFTDPGRASSALYEAQTQIHVASDTATLTTDLAYLLALYWAVSTMTTVGYGDIVPRNSYEIAYACCVIFTGSIVFGYIISNVSHIIAIEDDTDTKIKDKVSAINAYMAYRKLPPEMQKKIRTHYEYIWKRKTVYDEREILQQLPTFLRTRVALYLNQDLIRNVAFLRDLGSDCLALLVTELRPFRVSAGHWIFKQGALGREMCFLADGIVEVLGKKNKQLAVLQRGSYFGEFALLSDKPTKRSASVRALAAADLFALTKASFDAVLRVYPELQEEVQAHAEARLAEAMQGNQERDYNALPTLPAHVGSVSVPSSAVAAVFGTPGGGGPVQTPYFNIPGTPLAGPAAMPTMARPNSTPQQQQQQQPRPSFVSTPRGGLFPRSAAPGSSSSLVPPSGGSGLLSVPVPSHGHHHAHHASVSSLGFNPYLSLANSRIEGESEVELRRTLLRGKEELEIIMHPERADEIVAETAAEEARLNAHMEAEQEFIHFTSAVAGVPSPAMGPAIAGGTGGGGSAGAGAAAPSTPFIATLASVSEDEGGGPPHSAAAPGPGENDLNGSTRPRAPSNLELVGPLLPLQLAGRSGDAMSGVAGVSNEAATSFLAHLSATFDAALQPLHESQLHLVQMQRGLLQHQRELDQLVAELGL